IELDADEDVTLVDVDTTVEIDADTQGRMEEDVTAVKEISATEPEPTVFDDEKMAKRLHDEEVKQAAARERQEQDDFKRAQELQQQYDQKQENIDWNVVAEQIVGGVTQAYQSFEDMLKDFDREDMDAVWRITNEKFSTSSPIVDKEKALWAELTRLYEPNADDVF
nr:hypothetical protein [Tanacetum cinerariifolium]